LQLSAEDLTNWAKTLTHPSDVSQETSGLEYLTLTEEDILNHLKVLK